MPPKGEAAPDPGAGSTFVYPVLSAWAADYKNQTGNSMNYQSIGAGGGIAQVKAGTVEVGATNSRSQATSWPRAILPNFRWIVGGIVPIN